MSYNVLAPSLVQKNPQLYSRCTQRNLSWYFRMQGLLLEIGHHRPDVLCLQEEDENVRHPDGPFASGLRALGYARQSVVHRRRGDNMDGVAVYYRDDRWTLLYAARMAYQDVDANLRDNVCVLALLQCKRTHLPVLVANTHVLWNPRRGLIKLGQMQAVVGAMEHVLRRLVPQHPHRVPVVLCGDFNLTAHSPLWEYVVGQRTVFPALHANLDGCLSGQTWGTLTLIQDISWLDVQDQLVHTHPFSLACASTESGSSSVGKASQCVDFIFYGFLRSSDVDEDGLAPAALSPCLPVVPALEVVVDMATGPPLQPARALLHRWLQVPSDKVQALLDRKSIPDAHIPSDHVYLCAEFGLTPG
jgi:mRNA deadenylase 3'-5' endonuclease subunit Ccr4